MSQKPTNLLQVELSTPRLRLKPVSLEYVPEIFREFTTEITRWMYPCPPKSPKDSESFVHHSRKQMDQGIELVMAILDKTSGEYLGNCGIHNLPSATPELGIWLKKSAQGKGLGPEAIGELVRWAFETQNYGELMYPVASANIPSRRIPEGLGGTVFREYDEVGMGGNAYHILEYHIQRGTGAPN